MTTIPLEQAAIDVEPKVSRRWFSVFALSAASFVDGGEDQALSILWPQMYRSLGLTVGQLGPVLGISQLVSTIMLPIWGYAADRFSRKSLLVWITGIWGIWTLAIGLVDSLPQLLIVRVLSALGLGVFAPAAFSLISDLFPDQKRGRAAGIMGAVGVIGAIAAFGILPAMAEGGPEAWRNGFMVMGGASVATGLLMLLLPDPPRGASEPELGDVITRQAAKRYAINWADLQALIKIKSWRLLLLNGLLQAVGVGIFTGWAFTWLDSLGLGSSAFIVVLLMALGSILGAIFFGWLGDYLTQRFPDVGRVSLVLAGLIVTLPAVIIFLAIGAANTTLLVVIGFIFGAGLAFSGDGVSWPLAQAFILPEMRASGRAIINMVTGAASALILIISGSLADQVGVASMLLFIIPLPSLISILVWLPMFRAYRQDRAALHTTLAERRVELMNQSESTTN